MAISVNIPNNWQLPLFWAQVDGSMAGNLVEVGRALLVGQMITAGPNKGVAVQNIPAPIGSVAQAIAAFGPGSMLHRMVQAFFWGNTTQELWCLPVADPTAGAAATGEVTITTPPTASGQLTIYIGGQKVQILVASTDLGTAIATNLAAAINAIPNIPVTATAATDIVTLTCKWKGLTGNDITIIPNYLGPRNGEILPIGMVMTITPMASGTGEPDFTNAILATQDLEYDYVALPYTDQATLDAWANEYGFGPGGRWEYARQQYGMIFTTKRDTSANLITWGITQNAPVISTLGFETTSPSPVWEWTAAYCARGSQAFSADPARPLQTLEFPNILPAQAGYRFSQGENNSLTLSGIAAQTVAPSGNPMILREQTQYQLNSYGQADTAYALLTTLSNLQELLRRLKSAITTKFPRMKLFPDGTLLGPGQAAVTPGAIKAELIAEYTSAMYDGLCSNLSAFISNLLVQIDDNNPDRVLVLWPPQLAGQLRQFEVLAQFRLESATPLS